MYAVLEREPQPHERSWHNDRHAITEVGHIVTASGRPSFLHERQNGEQVEDIIFVIPGLVSGSVYDTAACVAVKSQVEAALIRHSKGGFSVHALETDAEEAAGVISVLGANKNIHVLGHSKGAKVAVDAVNMLDSSLAVASLILVAPGGIIPLGDFRNIHSSPRFIFEQVVSIARHPLRNKRILQGSMGEFIHSGPRVLGELVGIFTEPIEKCDLDRVKNRRQRTTLVLVSGDHDHLIPQQALMDWVDRRGLDFDVTMTIDGIDAGGHNGIMTNEKVMSGVVGVTELVSQAVRKYGKRPTRRGKGFSASYNL